MEWLSDPTALKFFNKISNSPSIYSAYYFAAERSEEASKALAAKREYKSRIEQIQRDFEEEQKQTFEITQDMTRQYKGMQEELLTRVCS